MATAIKERTVTTFIAVSHNLRIVFKPRRTRTLLDASGAVAAQPAVPVEELPAQPYLFDYNRTEELKAQAEDREPNLIDLEALPSLIDFKSQKFETDDPNIALALRVHPNLGRDVGGFKERYASAEERLAEVTRLTARGDVEGLRDLIELERKQGNHENVLDAAALALDALDTEAEPEGSAEGETAEAGSATTPQEPPDGPPNSPE